MHWLAVLSLTASFPQTNTFTSFYYNCVLNCINAQTSSRKCWTRKKSVSLNIDAIFSAAKCVCVFTSFLQVCWCCSGSGSATTRRYNDILCGTKAFCFFLLFFWMLSRTIRQKIHIHPFTPSTHSHYRHYHHTLTLMHNTHVHLMFICVLYTHITGTFSCQPMKEATENSNKNNKYRKYQ